MLREQDFQKVKYSSAGLGNPGQQTSTSLWHSESGIDCEWL